MVFWLYGRSGAGKTTLATRLEAGLRARGLHAFLLDGDELRSGLCSDLGFGEAARTENHRRAAEMAKLLVARGITVVAATMAPQYAQRDVIKAAFGARISQAEDQRLHTHANSNLPSSISDIPSPQPQAALRWIYVEAPLEVCAQRDPKGLYAKADAGAISKFKDFPFDPPRTTEVDLHLETEKLSIEQSYSRILSFAMAELSDYAI